MRERERERKTWPSFQQLSLSNKKQIKKKEMREMNCRKKQKKH